MNSDWLQPLDVDILLRASVTYAVSTDGTAFTDVGQIVDASEAAVTTPVQVFWPKGLRGVMTLTVGARTARRLRAYEVVASPTVRGIVSGVVATSTAAGCMAVARLGLPALAWGLLAVLAVLSLPLAGVWLFRVPQRPVDRGEGWVVLRRIDPITAQHWRVRNPAAGMVIEAAGRRPRTRPSSGQNWWEPEPTTP